MKSILIATCMFLSMHMLNAHALWIEAKAVGKAGQAVEVKVYYGEYANNEREDISKWYSDVSNFSLWLTAPGKEKIKLATVAGTNFYHTSFTPEKDGLYVLTVSHEAKELGGTTKYTFSSIATVSVGKINVVDPSSFPNSLKVAVNQAQVYKVSTPVNFKAVIDGKPWANKNVSVLTPEGWSKEFKTDENGNTVFTPIWPGRYVLEVSNYENTSGEHNGKKYEAVWQGATFSFEVAE